MQKKRSDVRVKICGLQDIATIRAMDGLPVDEIGFVFAKSRRQVSPELAGSLIAEVKKLNTPSGRPPRTVGVFVGGGIGELRELLEHAPIDVIQLHGSESPELCKAIKLELGAEVWKVFSVSTDDNGDEAIDPSSRLNAYRGAVDAVLIDTAGGGTGKTFAWHVVGDYAKAAHAIGVPLYVAGGLSPDNVRELLDHHPADGVDVSSGVETDGTKDSEKINQFVKRVKRI
ncbi:phosphoribosylanthranilate isomerase [Paenibacillus spongiae]|uniref:N-(5'-phosphoribosyl)anthranilate isomerase n=1 Tax=Paenibacillus spongiae TaxID=2909671 RepID=A0ABY5SEJ9_9BACL|nr:phosphoribosylanthranilate isomerase [Paenibacillus spongiae]UVI32402.1 phosphoribosylanthranilate isomerase [Paenibacillus spongiae]